MITWILGAIVVCMLAAGVGWLCGAESKTYTVPTEYTPQVVKEDKAIWSLLIGIVVAVFIIVNIVLSTEHKDKRSTPIFTPIVLPHR